MLKVFSGGQLLADRFGSSPPYVLALHGWARDRQDFSTVLADLDALAVDLPGFGLSPPPEAAWGTIEYAHCLLPILQEYPSPPVVIGHSFGGRVAVRLASLFPHHIRSLVLTGVPLLRNNNSRSVPPLAVRVGRKLNKKGLFPQSALEWLRNKYGSADYRAAEGLMRKIFVRVVNENYEQDLRSLSCRVQMVWGSADSETPPEIAHRAAAMIPRAEVTIVPNIGHLLPVSAPKQLCAAVQQLRES
jgi:pimeloyl-ACP methyl ester carboxylesterase